MGETKCRITKKKTVRTGVAYKGEGNWLKTKKEKEQKKEHKENIEV